MRAVKVDANAQDNRQRKYPRMTFIGDSWSRETRQDQGNRNRRFTETQQQDQGKSNSRIMKKGRLVKEMQCRCRTGRNSGNRGGLIKQIQDRYGGKIRRARSKKTGRITEHWKKAKDTTKSQKTQNTLNKMVGP